MMNGPLLALSFSLVAAQPALRGAGAGTRALLFSNFVGTDVETVAPTAEQRGSGFCFFREDEYDGYGYGECDVSEPDCSGETGQWFAPGTRRTVPLRGCQVDSGPAPGAPVAAHNVHWGRFNTPQLSVRGLE